MLCTYSCSFTICASTFVIATKVCALCAGVAALSLEVRSNRRVALACWIMTSSSIEMVLKSLMSKSGKGSCSGSEWEKVFSRDDILGLIFLGSSIEGTQAYGSDVCCLYR